MSIHATGARVIYSVWPWHATCKYIDKPVGDYISAPSLVQMSLPWQQGSAHNILHGSIESAIPENPLVGANISGLYAIQADL